MSKSFGSKKLHRCLIKLDFSQKGIKSSHAKYFHNHGKTGSKPFMIIQLGKKTYGKNACNRYISQLKKFGYTKKEIEDFL